MLSSVCKDMWQPGYSTGPRSGVNCSLPVSGGLLSRLYELKSREILCIIIVIQEQTRGVPHQTIFHQGVYMDKIATGIIDKLSIVGFFNVILSGAVLLYGLSPVLNQHTPEAFYTKLGLETDLEKGIILCLICYIIGCALQSLQEYLFKGLKASVVKNCLVNTEKTAEGTQGKSVLGNRCKEEGIIKLASDLFSEKKLGKFDPENKEMCSYFVDYCEYSNSIKEYGSKAGKLSESATFYQQLTAAFYVLAVIGILLSVFTHKSGWIYCIGYLLLGSIFLGRAYQSRLDWLKAVLATYEAVADKEKYELELYERQENSQLGHIIDSAKK